MAAGSYKMTLDKVKKEYYIYAEGVFTPEIGMAYTKEFMDKSKSIDPKEYTLVVDVKNLNTNTTDVAQMLSNVLKMYFSFPYKKVIMTKIGNAICMMQVKQLLANTPGHEKLEFVDSVDKVQL